MRIEIGNNQYVSDDPDDENIYHADGSICDCYDNVPMCYGCGREYDECTCPDSEESKA